MTAAIAVTRLVYVIRGHVMSQENTFRPIYMIQSTQCRPYLNTFEVNELLCYVQLKGKILPFDDLVRLCADLNTFSTITAWQIKRFR